MKIKLVLLIILTNMPGIVHAALTPFDTLSRQVAQFSGYHSLAPATPLGVTGYDLSLETTNGIFYTTPVSITKIRLQKGLPSGIDLALEYGESDIPSSSAPGTAFGIAASYYFLRDSALTPNLALRASYSYFFASGVIQFNAYTLDVTASKKLTYFNPYFGIGLMAIDSNNLSGFPNYNGAELHYFLGASLKLKLIDIAIEYGGLGNLHDLSLKLGYRF